MEKDVLDQENGLISPSRNTAESLSGTHLASVKEFEDKVAGTGSGTEGLRLWSLAAESQTLVLPLTNNTILGEL